MHFVETELHSDGTAWLVIKETVDRRDVFAVVVLENYCRHQGPGRYLCLIDPPAWSYWVGGHYRFSLGGQLWRFGQWVCSRTARMPEVLREQISLDDLVMRYGWSPGRLAQCD
jgi:hypothetical protein